jgi:hypothetical protein
MECYLPLECREMEIDGKRWGALDASPAVMKDNSVPPDRRSRCRVAGRISALLSSIV